MDSEIGRFPRLFRRVDSVPGLTWPSLIFDRTLTIRMGGLEVRIEHAGRGHTKGDTIVWLPTAKVLFAGDLVEFGATPYCGDAHLKDWPATLSRLASLGAEKLVPGRGEAVAQSAAPRDPGEATRAGCRPPGDRDRAGGPVNSRGPECDRGARGGHEVSLRRLEPHVGRRGDRRCVLCRRTGQQRAEPRRAGRVLREATWW